MRRFLPLMSLFCIFCNCSNESFNYRAKGLYFSTLGELTQQVEVLFSELGDEKKWHTESTTSKGIRVSDMRLVRQGRTQIRYNKNELDSITTKDEQTNCETQRSFSKGTVYERTTCNGRVTRVISIGKDHLLEHNCSLNSGLETCRCVYNGSEHYEYHYEIGQNQIYSSYRPLLDEGLQEFAMWSTRDIPHGQIIEEYHLVQPVGAVFPTPNDSRWLLDGKTVKTGYISQLQDFSSKVATNSNGSSRHTLELY